jgi:hypothetical protein
MDYEPYCAEIVAGVGSSQRILAAVWRCVRAGQLPAAHAVCRGAGQAWREGSLGGGAGFGPAEVGAAADAADAAEQVGAASSSFPAR